MTQTLHALLFLLLSTSTAFGQNGTFDPTFGNQGHQQFSIDGKNAMGYFLLALPDGSFIVAGSSYENHHGSLTNKSLFFSKHNADGHSDISFGDNGLLSVNSGGDTWMFDAILQPDGKILVSGKTNGTSILMRFDQNGTYDASFGTNGIAATNGQGPTVVGTDGKITVVDYFHDGYATMYRFSRFNPNGSPDLTFGTGGHRTNDISGYRYDLPFAVNLQDDKIVVAGVSYDVGDQQHAMVSRFLADGSPDVSFGGTGTVTTSFGAAPGYGVLRDLAFNDGKIIVVGSMEYVGGTGGYMGSKAVVVRFDANGNPDSTFGNGGKVVLDPLFSANDSFHSLAIQSDGKIIATGTAGHPFPNPQTHLIMTRLNANGSPDTTFGSNGTVQTDNQNVETNGARKIKLLPDGKILCLGYTRAVSDGNFDVLLCRLKSDHTLGTIDIQSNLGLTVYPNPAKNHTIIKGVQKQDVLRLYNALGQQFRVVHSSVIGHQATVDLTGLSAGTYFLSVERASGNRMVKLVVN